MIAIQFLWPLRRLRLRLRLRLHLRLRPLAPLWLLFSLLVVSQFPTREAQAQPASSKAAGVGSDEEGLIGRGLELREKGDDEAALGAFRKAYELSKGARALAQVALAEQALGRWGTAEAHLGQAVARTDDRWIARNKPLLEQALTEIQGHLGSLQLSGGVAGAEVRINGETVGSLPLEAPIRVPAGSVALEVRAQGFLPVVRTVSIPARGLARESVVLVATGPAVSATSSTAMANDVAITTVGATTNTAASSSTTWGNRKTAAVVLGAGAVVALGVGTAFLFIRDSRAKDYNDPTAGCYTGDPNPSKTCMSLRDKEQSALVGGVVGLAGAVVLGGAAAYLFLTDHSADQKSVALAHRAFAIRCSPSTLTAIACAGAF
jgi:PEGA domain